MAHNTSVEAIPAAVAGGAGALAGSILGLPVMALFAGFAGGLVWLSLAKPSGAWWSRVLSLSAATLTAGFLGPYTAAVLHVAHVNADLELAAFSFLWSAGMQSLLPRALDALGRRIDQAGGPPQ